MDGMEQIGSDGRHRRFGWAAGLIAAGVIAGGALGATLSASADTTPAPSTSSTSSSGTAVAPAVDAPGGQRPGETLLTGTNAAKVKAAALKAVPGATIVRLETDADGAVYEAHITKSDGTRATVKFDKDFNVTAVETGMGGGARGAGGPAATGTSA